MKKLRLTDNRWHGDQEAFKKAVHSVFANLKIVFGAVNNCTFLHMGDALMKLNDVEMEHSKHRFIKKVWQEWKDYECGLKYSDAGFFRLDLLDEEKRKKFGENATNEDYFDFWTANGGAPYRMTLPLVSCLTNKYRLLLERWGVKQADKKAALLTIFDLLYMQLQGIGHAIDTVVKTLGVVRADVYSSISPFSLKRVGEAWSKLMREVIPELTYIQPDELEKKNINMTKRQIEEMMDTTDFLFSGLTDAIENYDDLFASQRDINTELKNLRAVRDYFNEF